MQTFTTESDLTETALNSRDFYKALGHTDWLRWDEREPAGLFGIPDVVFAFAKTSASGGWILRTFAFEMKLHDWKKALAQAFKYAAFAHYPFVVMDHKNVERAKRQVHLFEKSNIGLMSITPSGQTHVHCRPRFRQPYSATLRKALSQHIKGILSPTQVSAAPEPHSHCHTDDRAAITRAALAGNCRKSAKKI